ncbi:MAG: thrombospondin type 3 repeat-containing protein [Patescibacteria group bacterium]
MFEDKQVIKPTSNQSAPPKVEVASSEVIIHSMPKEFYDKAVKIKELPKAQPPKPVQPPVAVQQPAVIKKPLPPPVPQRSNKFKVLVVILLLLIALAAAGLGLAYSQGYLSFNAGTPVVVEPEPVITQPIEPVPIPEPAKPISGADTDSDGLTNVEELLYGTDFRNPDSDSDTFLDGNEIFHRFDPRGLAPSTLLDTGAVRVLESLELPFVMYYPTTWNPVSTPVSQRVTFRSPTGAGVNVLWQEKSAKVSLEDWYVSQVGEVEISRLQPTLTKEGYEALIGPDERVMYVAANGQVYTLIYDLGDATSIEFLQTFKMMVNSFKLVP